MKRFYTYGMTVLLIALILLPVGCKKASLDDEGNTVTREKYEDTVAYLSFSIFDVIWTTYDTATSLPASASYDSSTGWWSFTIVLATGESADVEIKFLDKNKNTIKYYNPFSTYYILMKGDSTGTLGTISYDLEMSGVQGESTTLTINGDGEITYLGSTAAYEIDDMVVIKTGAYPTSGTLKVIFNNTSITVTYNGTQNVTATYTFLGFSYSFTINLATGDIF